MDQPVQFGRYLLHRRIAVGGMAEIFKGTLHGISGFEKSVVVKQILPQYAHSDEFIEMLIDEAKIAVSLDHGNIVAIYELGKAEGIYFIAMEYVHGKTVAEMLETARDRKMPIPVDMAMFIAAEICKGLDYMHRRHAGDGTPLQVVHRDINPANVMVSTDGMVKIADFGIAKARNKAAVTERGVVKGTYGYMSPEQITGRAVDYRTDIFSTGVVFYEMLAGARLFPGTDILEQVERVRQADIPPPSLACPRVPPDLDGIVLKALATAPDDRYQDASALQIELSRFLFSPGRGATSATLAEYMRELFPLVPTEDSGLRNRKLLSFSLGDDQPDDELEWGSSGSAGSGTQSIVIRADMIEGAPGTQAEPALAPISPPSDESMMSLFTQDSEAGDAGRRDDAKPSSEAPLSSAAPSAREVEGNQAALPSKTLSGVGQNPLLNTADLLPSHTRKPVALWVLGGALSVGALLLLLQLATPPREASRVALEPKPAPTPAAPTPPPPATAAVEASVEASPTPPAEPTEPTGSIVLMARPDETSIYLHVGDTPVALAALGAGRSADEGQGYLVRLEQTGYRTVERRLEADEIRSGTSITIAMQRQPEAPGKRPTADPSPGEASEEPALTSDPPGASVWLAVGEGQATLADLPHRRYYFMARHPGYETAFVTVLASQFASSDGSVREAISLAKAARVKTRKRASAAKARKQRRRSTRAARARRKRQAAERQRARRTQQARRKRRPSKPASESSGKSMHLPQWAD